MSRMRPRSTQAEQPLYCRKPFINSLAGSNSRAGACGGGLEPGMLEYAFPAWAGTHKYQQPVGGE